LFEDVGDVLAADGLEAQGILQGAVDLLRAVDFAQSDDLLDVVAGVEVVNDSYFSPPGDSYTSPVVEDQSFGLSA